MTRKKATKKDAPASAEKKAEAYVAKAEVSMTGTDNTMKWLVGSVWTHSDKDTEAIFTAMLSASQQDWKWLAHLLLIHQHATKEGRGNIIHLHPDMLPALDRLQRAVSAASKVQREGMALAG